MKYKSLEEYEYLSTAKHNGGDLYQEGVSCYRTKLVQAGPILYIKCYPCVTRKIAAQIREKAGRGTKKAQEVLNRKRGKEKLEQWVNANFVPGDVMITNTYTDEEMPDGDDVVRKDVRNYLDRLRRAASKAGRELKYIYVIEMSEPYDHDPNGIPRWHVHMVLSGVDRDTAEDVWKYGESNARRLQDSKEAFSGISNYMLKRNATTWRTSARSRNLVPPVEKVTNRRPAKHKVDRIARDVAVAGKVIMGKLYPGYSLIDEVQVKYSEFMPGAYISCRMRKIGKWEPRENARARDKAGAGAMMQRRKMKSHARGSAERGKGRKA